MIEKLCLNVKQTIKHNYQRIFWAFSFLMICANYSCANKNILIDSILNVKPENLVSMPEPQIKKQDSNKVNLLESLELVETPNEKMPFMLVYKPTPIILKSIVNNEFDVLIAYYSNLKTQDTNILYADYSLSSIYLLSGDYSSALSLLNALIEKTPDFLPLYVNRIIANRALGNEKLVDEDSQIIFNGFRAPGINFDPISIRLIDGMKFVSFGKKFFSVAFLGDEPPLPSNILPIDKFFQAREIMYSSGTNYVERTRDMLEDTSLKHKEFSRLNTLRGVCYSELGNHVKANASFKEAIRLQPKSSEAYYQYGKYKIKIKDFKIGVENLEIARMLMPERADILFELVEAYLQNEDFQKIISTLDANALSKFIDYSSSYYYSQQGDYDARILIAKILLIKGDAHRESGQYKLSQEAYLQAIDVSHVLDNDYRYIQKQAFFKLAISYYFSGDFHSAISELTRLVNDPISYSSSIAWNEIESLYLWRGKSFSKLGRFQEAKNDFKKILEINPKNYEARSHLNLM